MAHDYIIEDLPVAPLKLAAHKSALDFAKKVDAWLVKFRKHDYEIIKDKYRDTLMLRGFAPETFLLDLDCPRFGSGEAKGVIRESVRGVDEFILCDITNYSNTYTVNGFTNHMSPDDNYQDMKRLIGASIARTHRVSVIMPFLYESRQHKRSQRESLDCAMALEELTNMGVKNIITFDAHDPRVQNAIPLKGFDNFMPTYQFLKTMVASIDNFKIDNEHLMIISPDEGAMQRAVYFSNILGVDMGMFYKRRDYSTIVNGKNPIVAHEFLGDSVEGKDVVVIDDMISSGESMLDVAKKLKDRKARRVIVCTTFGLFTDGLEKFDEYYEKEYIYRVITTNLSYRNPELLKRPYYLEADMSKYLASIMDILNHDLSVEKVRSTTQKINQLLKRS